MRVNNRARERREIERATHTDRQIDWRGNWRLERDRKCQATEKLGESW